MATKTTGHQGEVKDPEHDGRLKGHKGGEAPKAHAEKTHPDEKAHAEPKASAKSHEAPAHEGKAPAKATHAKPADEPQKAEPASDSDAELKSREYTDAQGNVHHHTKAYMESHKGQ